MSAATIYHYFPDKQRLYEEAVLFAFSDKEPTFFQVWDGECPAEEKLANFVRVLFEELVRDRNFHRLMQREILEADPGRMQLLAQDIFKEQFMLLLQLAAELAPQRDAHLTAISILSLVKHHLEMQPLRQYFPGWKPEHESPEFLAAHVVDLLLTGLRGNT